LARSTLVSFDPTAPISSEVVDFRGDRERLLCGLKAFTETRMTPTQSSNRVKFMTMTQFLERSKTQSFQDTCLAKDTTIEDDEAYSYFRKAQSTNFEEKVSLRVIIHTEIEYRGI
jgi:hypothetical protein